MYAFNSINDYPHQIIPPDDQQIYENALKEIEHLLDKHTSLTEETEPDIYSEHLRSQLRSPSPTQKDDLVGYIGPEEDLNNAFYGVIPHYYDDKNLTYQFAQGIKHQANFVSDKTYICARFDMSGIGKTAFFRAAAKMGNMLYAICPWQSVMYKTYKTCCESPELLFPPDIEEYLPSQVVNNVLRKLIFDAFYEYFLKLEQELREVKDKWEPIMLSVVRVQSPSEDNDEAEVRAQKQFAIVNEQLHNLDQLLLFHIDEFQEFESSIRSTKREELSSTCNRKNIKDLFLSQIYHCLYRLLTNVYNLRLVVAISGTYGSLHNKLIHSPCLPHTAMPETIQFRSFTLDHNLDIFNYYWNFPRISKQELVEVLSNLDGPGRLCETFHRILLSYSKEWYRRSRSLDTITKKDIEEVMLEAQFRYLISIQRRVKPFQGLLSLYIRLYLFYKHYGGDMEELYGGEWIYYKSSSVGYQILSENQNILMETGLVRVVEYLDGIAIEKPYSYLLRFHNMQALAKNKKVRHSGLTYS
jgi:hypothetical protein